LAYAIPTGTEMAFIAPYLAPKAMDSAPAKSNTTKGIETLLNKFIDKDKKATRISVNMKDIGSAKLPLFIAKIDSATKALFDTAKYHV
jgi:hypothetical protein